MSISVSYGGSSILQGIQPESIECAQLADMGETATGAFTVEDDAAALTIIGYQPLTISESACSQPRLFTGWTFERTYQRDAENAILTGSARTHDVSIIDMNACFGFRQITRTGTGGGNRPAETWADRLTWILESEYLSDWISSDQSFVVTNTTMMDATDYLGSYPSAVMQDLSDRSGNAYDYFAFWDPAALEVRLFFDNAVESIGDSTLRISNVLSDWDGLTTFGPDKLAKLTRESDQVYSDVCVNYADGSLKLYVSRPSTYATFVRRSTQIDRPYTRSVATARLQADAWLTKHAVETDRVSCTIRVPASRAGLVQAGQRIQFKAPHMPGYEVWTWMRVVMCTPKPVDDTATMYDIALELTYQAAGSGVTPPLPDWQFGGNRGTHYLWAGEIVTSAAGDIPEHGYAEWQTGTSFALGTVTGYGLTFAHVHPNPAGAAYVTPGSGWTELEETTSVGSSADHTAVLQNTNAGTLGSPIATMPNSLWAGSYVAFPAGSTLRQWKSYNHALTGEGTTLTFDTDPLADSFLLVFQASGSWFGGGLDLGVGGIPSGWTTLDRYVSFENWGTEIDNRIVYHLGSSDPGAGDTETTLPPTGTPIGNYAAAADPTVTDDADSGYSVGSVWVNTATGDAWVLVDSTVGAAVWVSTTTGAPTDVDYLVGTASGSLSAEIVVGTTPGGELGGTWASPTVDATHAGSAHLALGSTSITAAAGDHTHTSGAGELLITDTPAGSPLVFADILQNEAGTELLYND